MKDKAAIVIAVLMITSIAFALSTTSVGALPEATISPTTVRENTRVKLTITVTNPSTTDKIENIAIMVYGSGQNFTEAIGGTLTAENLKLAADNLENAVAPLNRAGENLKLAADNKKNDAAPAVSSAGTSLQSAAIRAAILVMENDVATSIENAGLCLIQAGDNIAAASENFTLIVSLLNSAKENLDSAAGDATPENMWSYNPAAAENLDNAAERIGDAATALQEGSLRRAGENLKIAGDNLENTGTALGGAAGNDFISAGTSLRNAGQALVDAAQYDNLAGINLVLVADYLESVAEYLDNADSDLENAAYNLDNDPIADNIDAASRIKWAGENLKADPDNVLMAGSQLSLAADNLSAAASELGADLGGDELEDAMEHENAAAENLKVGDVDLGTAGDQLIAAADDLSAAASKLLATANALVPAGWSIAEDINNKIRFDANNENYFIAAGDSETFVFLWKTPDVADIENDYTIRVYYYKENATTPFTYDTVTLTVDGKVPTLTINVTQTGVATVNLVGTVYDNAQATVTITASEELSSIGTVYVENEDNFIPPLTLENTGNTVFTATFTVGAWDDNSCVVRVTSAKDLVGLENTNMENSFTVDTRAPILIENAIGVLENLPTSIQPGTTNTYRVTENKLWNLDGVAEDNYDSADNGKWVTVTINGVTANKNIPPLENEFYLDNVELSEGINSVIVIATDRTGNQENTLIENVFCDNTQATFTLTQLANRTSKADLVAADNYIYIDRADNLLTIEVTLSDTGYPTTQWGVVYENVRIRLLHDDGTGIDNLDNATPWVVGEDITWENTYTFGLADNWYRLEVCVGDNITENYLENIRFRMDTTVPDADIPATNTTLYHPVTMEYPIPHQTKITEILVKGSADEPKSTIYIYAPDNVTEKGHVQAGTDRKFSLSITLDEGVNKIYIQEVDQAGNESDRVLYGTYWVDKTAPVITLSEPTTGISTGEAQITVSGTVVDALVAYDQLAVTIDCTGSMVSKTVYLNADGSFSTTVPLVEGTNVISVVAADGAITTLAGNQTISTVTVTRTVTPVATYAIVIVIVALVLAAIAIFRKR